MLNRMLNHALVIAAPSVGI